VNRPILANLRDEALGISQLVRNLWAVPLLVPLLIILVGCAGITTAANSTPVVGTPIAVTDNGTQVVTVQALDTMQFAPNSIIVQAGHPIQLTLKNDGQMVHDFTLTDGVAQPVKLVAQPGQSATGTFTIEHPGTYSFICSQPGHQIRGMKGTITAR
jgi:uncharacterized cupredoxin-like copper-binding protein